MAFVRGLLWSGFCIWLGVLAATVEVAGRTPVDHLKRLWSQHQPQLRAAADDVKQKLTAPGAPTEQHSVDDKDAVNRIIAKRQQK